MNIFDAHIDVADLALSFNFNIQDFYSKKDIPVSLELLKSNNIKTGIFTLYFDKGFLKTNFYDGVNSFIEFYKNLSKHNNTTKLITSLDQIDETKIFNYFLSIEGLDCFREINDFNHFYKEGVRSYGLTWINDNLYATGRETKTNIGLTPLGLNLIKLMNEKRLIIDISHASEKTVRDLEKSYTGGLIASHSNVKNLCNDSHNLTDDEIDIIVERNGVIGIFPLISCIGENSLDKLYEHIDYIASKWGIEFVGLSSDIYPLKEYPFINNAKNINILSEIKNYLSAKLNKEDLDKILYQNWHRVIKEFL